MITRSDIYPYCNSPSDLSNLTPCSGMDTSIEYTSCKSNIEIQYSDIKYPDSFYELSQDIDNSTKEDNVSLTLKNIVDDMLKSATNGYNNSFSLNGSSDKARTDEVVNIKSDNVRIFQENSIKNSLKDNFCIRDDNEIDIKDEIDPLSYSDPHTPSEQIKSDNYSSPLCPTENIQSYDDHNSDVEMNDTKPAFFQRSNYDTSALMYENDDMTMLTGLVNCDEVLKNHKRKDIGNERGDTIVCCYRSGSVSSSDESSLNTSTSCSNNDTSNYFLSSSSSTNREKTNYIPSNSKISGDNDDNNNNNSSNKNFKGYEKNNSCFSHQDISFEDPDNRKGKITGLQRKALDSIFSVTDRPSRGLVLHIAGELCLHHITVKNFFSNGRRRLRRAAARLNDPERTRRENQKRKEKRRLAALAAAASSSNGDKISSKGSGDGATDTQAREPPVLSPERRALMEKLAVKVQRSVAQKGLAANSGDSASPTQVNPPAKQNSKCFLPQTPENLQLSQLHSSAKHLTLNEPMKPLNGVQSLEEPSFMSQNKVDFGAIFSYAEHEPFTTYESSPDHHSINIYANEQDNTNSYYGMNAEEGPFSPTSWQTLIHT